MQATVHRFEPESGSGELVTDTGYLLPFTATELAASGLRSLRQGQRLSVTVGEDGRVTGLRLGAVNVVADPPAHP